MAPNRQHRDGRAAVSPGSSFVVLLALLTWTIGTTRTAHGLGVNPTDTNQKVAVVYVQAADYRIPAADLTGINNDEDDELQDTAAYFDETSWGTMSLDFDQYREAGGSWVTLPSGLFHYATASGIRHTEVLSPGSQVNSNPTPPVGGSVAAAASASSSSRFESNHAGDYWYAVSAYRTTSNAESAWVATPAAVSVAEGDVVELEWTKSGADDVSWFIIYRTATENQANNAANYERIAEVVVTNAATVDYAWTDTNNHQRTGVASTADHEDLAADACDAASHLLSNLDQYRGFIVILYSTFLRGSARSEWTICTGGTDGTTLEAESIYQSVDTGPGRFFHEIGHWLGLPDEYDPVTANIRGFYTTMDGANEYSYAAWEKHYGVGWISHAAGNIVTLQRPAMGDPDIDETYILQKTNLEDSVAGEYTAIRIEIAAGVHWTIEARDPTSGVVSDSNSATNRVVVFEAIDAWPPGLYPKRNLNVQQVMQVGDSYVPEDFGGDQPITIEFLSVIAGSPDKYEVRIVLEAHPQPDLLVTPWGAPPYETVDIWVDSNIENDGWHPTNAAPLPGNGEHAWVGNVNRVYVRVHNIGEGDAQDVKVRIRVNTPGGMGDAGNFVDLSTIVPASQDIPAGETRNFYGEWTPDSGDHTCIEVEVEHVVGEADINNNYAQENFWDFYSEPEGGLLLATTAWQPIHIPIRVANPYDSLHKIYVRNEKLPPGWNISYSFPANRSILVNATDLVEVSATITPSPDEPPCTHRLLTIHGMTNLGNDDWITVYDGMSPFVHLVKPIQLRYTVVYELPNPNSLEKALVVHGYVVPAVPFARVAIVVFAPDGSFQVYFTTADALGEFWFAAPVGVDGKWSAFVYYQGDRRCSGPTQGPRVSVQVGRARGHN